MDEWLDDSAASSSSLLLLVLQKLRKVIDPDLNRDIVSLQFIRNLKINEEDGDVYFELHLTTSICPVKDEFINLCTKYVKELSWVNEVNIKICVLKNGVGMVDGEMGGVGGVGGVGRLNLLSGVSFIIAVMSCKGGVGKSMISVNLAFMLNQLGAKVGIVDADVYGPSLHLMIPKEGEFIHFKMMEGEGGGKRLGRSGREIHYEDEEEEVESESAINNKYMESPEGRVLGMIPLEYKGVKLMSYGYIKPHENQGYAAFRGVLASGVAHQMVSGTMWGELDYLIIDMPPGTGDIHLSVAQDVPITAAVMVTTPQSLSVKDVEKGLLMFNEVKIPTIAIIENMSYFICDKCDVKHKIFDGDELNNLIQKYGVGYHLQLPLHKDLAKMNFNYNGEDVYPFVNGFDENSMLWLEFKKIAEMILREASSVKFNKRAPFVAVNEENYFEMIIQNTSKNSTKGTMLAEEVLFAPARDVRRGCRCVECKQNSSIEEQRKNRKMLHDISVHSVKQSGTYCVTIEWSDGHTSILSFDAIEQICRSHAATLPPQSSTSCIDSNELYDW